MNILKILRKPYIAMLMASMFFYVSCNQYETPEIEIANKFDYSVFKEFSEGNSYNNIMKVIKNTKSKIKNKSSLEINKYILKVVNDEMGTELKFPELVLEMVDNDVEKIFSTAIENEWMTKDDVSLTKSFMNDLELKGFDKAINNYEKTILKLELSAEEFSKKNIFINTMKSMKYIYPEIFDKDVLKSKSTFYKSWWRCALAATGLVAATAGLSSCATIVACGVAIAAHVAAMHAVADNCFAE